MRLAAVLFLAAGGLAWADSLTLRDGTTLTGSWAGFSDGQISFVVDGTVKTYPKSQVSKVTFGDTVKAPGTVKIGETSEQVKAALGEPKIVATTGSSHEIWTYPDVKIVFTDGKVSSVE